MRVAAPEVLDRFRGGTRPYNGKLADVWSSGVMLHVMLFCAYPFERPDDDPKDKKHNAAVLQRVLRGTSPSRSRRVSLIKHFQDLYPAVSHV